MHCSSHPKQSRFLKILTMKTNTLGAHQKRLLDFCRRWPGPHSLTSNQSDPAHRALQSLSRRGLLVRLCIGSTVMAELPVR